MRGTRARDPAGMSGFGRVDAWLERLYARLGWRVLLIYLGVAWMFGLVIGIAAVPVLGDALQLDSAARWELLWVIVLGWAVTATTGTAVALRLLRPLLGWLRADVEPDAPAANWSALHRLPHRISFAQAVVAFALALPTLVVANVRAADPDPPGAFFVFLLGGGAVAVLLTVCVGIFGLQLLLRPVLRDLALRVQDPPAPEGAASIRMKLFLAIPVIALGAALATIAVSVDRSVDWFETTSDLALIAVVGLLFLVPAGALLAHSTLAPLDDLMRATERLKRGDFESRVPELSGDEYGVLARSFNEAMEGLAERQRLAVANETLLEEVKASRARIVAASDAERRRIERNIHDGAQQRLVSLALELQAIADLAERSQAPELVAAAAEARETVRLTLAELRELARGLHPAVLTTEGLAPAVRQLAARMRLPVAIEADSARFPEPLESAAYFIAAEALTNAAKYAQASQVDVSIARRNGSLLLEVRDDGIGGARASENSGLAGLADRVAALNGRLSVRSASGGGTTVCAELPLQPEPFEEGEA